MAIPAASAKKALNLFVPPQTVSQGDLLPVYCRAHLSRTITLVVALLLTAVWTSVFAREFRAADTQNEDCPTVEALRYMGNLVAERTRDRHQVKAFHSRQPGEEKETRWSTSGSARSSSIAPTSGLAFYDSGARSICDMSKAWAGLSPQDPNIFREAAMGGVYDKAQRYPAIAQLIEPIRKVE
jgi:hypothetical protein